MDVGYFQWSSTCLYRLGWKSSNILFYLRRAECSIVVRGEGSRATAIRAESSTGAITRDAINQLFLRRKGIRTSAGGEGTAPE